jgi:regulator of protease activity HflC (stomatin/prohibitin superfamily)
MVQKMRRGDKMVEEIRLERIIPRIIIGGFLIIIFSMMLFGTFYQINAGQRGVVLTFGKPTMLAMGEGLHMKIPMVQKIIKMEVRTQKYEAELTAASKDLQDVQTKIAINYHIIPEQVPIIYTEIGMDYAEKVIYPYEQETNKGITSQFTAEELITKRESVRGQMKIDLAEKLRPRGIIVEEVSIIDFKFSESFSASIENKVVALQLKLKADNDLERIKIEAEQKITTAQAEATSIRIQSSALQENKDILQLRAIEKWDGKMPQVIGSAMPFIDIPLNGNYTK